MSLNATTVITRIRELVEDVDGVKRAYSDHEEGNNGLPGGTFETPCAIVLAGPTVSYEQRPTAWERHEYDIRILVLASEGEISQRGLATGPIVDQIVTAFDANVTLGGRVQWIRFDRQSGYTTFEYGGGNYSGYEIVVRVCQKNTMSNLAFGS